MQKEKYFLKTTIYCEKGLTQTARRDIMTTLRVNSLENDGEKSFSAPRIQRTNAGQRFFCPFDG
ncbi:MAG: hypothetical protein J1F39_05575 [Clostridiales bacterium]|nr:hypothetical protein [Clostridiales bacterium]